MNLLPKIIYSTSTRFSGEIKVVEFGQVRRLIVGGLVQSVSRNYPEIETKVWGFLARPPYPLPHGSSILMLGLGGGTSLHLAAKFLKPARLLALEIDSRIIQIAKDYFEIDRIKGLEAAHADAFEYLNRKVGEKFDLIIIDLYAGSNFPKQATTKAFYQKIKNHLKGGGVTSINRIYDESEVLERRQFLSLLQGVFGEVLEKTVSSSSSRKNYIYYCQNQSAST